MINNTSYNLTQVQGSGGAGEREGLAPMSVPSDLVLSVRSTPRGASADAVSVFLGGARLTVALASIDPSERSARLTAATRPSTTAGSKSGLVAFGAAPAGCDDACCAAGACGGACAGVYVACFSVSFFDDLLPQLKVKSHMQTILIYDLSSRKFTTHNNLH